MLRAFSGLLSRAPAARVAAPALAPQLTLSRGLKFKSRMSRPYPHRWAMMKNMLTSLIEHERIKTGWVKAKQVSRLTDRMVTYAKRGDLSAYRQASKYVKTKHCMTKLFTSARTCTRQSVAVAHYCLMTDPTWFLRSFGGAIQGARGWIHAGPQDVPARGRSS
jgi:ribosomal protein L17